MKFPAVDGESLAGTPLSFPASFAGARTIVLVAFDLKQRRDCETWVPFIDRFARSGIARAHLFPTLSRSMRLMKGAIVATMRKADPSPEARAATVPLFVDLDKFCAALGIADRSQIAVFAVEPDGSIGAHCSGPFNSAAGSLIEAQIAAPR